MNSAAEMVKQRVKMTDIVSLYGFHPNHSGFMCCPFHNEKTPSLKIYPGGQGWYCYGCGAGGSVIDFVMQLFHENFGEAIAKLDSDFALGLQTGPLSLRDKRRLAQRQAELQERLWKEQTARREYDIMYQMVAAKYRGLRKEKPPTSPQEQPSGEFIEALQQIDFLEWWLDEYINFERWKKDYVEEN